jgi:hypothetical protein
VLAAGVFVILLDGLGLETSLSNRLFDAYQQHAARPRPADSNAISGAGFLDLPDV